MYREKIRKLEQLVEAQSIKLEELKKNHQSDEFSKLNNERANNIRELSSLRKLQWEEDHERVNFDDDR